MEPLNRDAFVSCFQTCYTGSEGPDGEKRDLFESLRYNDMLCLKPLLGQTEDVSWFTPEWFKDIYDHIVDVYYWEAGLESWSGLFRLDNDFYFFFQASTGQYSGFSSYGTAKMFVSKNIDHLLTFGLNNYERKMVERVQTDAFLKRATALLQ